MDLSKIRSASAKRMVNGTEVPRQGATSCGVRAAMKKGGSAYAGESGEVEGETSRPRLDRPARKNGGCVKKADGGSVLDAFSTRDDTAAKRAMAEEMDAMDAVRAAAAGAGAGMAGRIPKAAMNGVGKNRLNAMRNVAPSMGRKSGGAVKKKC